MKINNPATVERSGKKHSSSQVMPEQTIEDLIERVRRYSPEADADLLRRAYEFARVHHEGQLRFSGIPYITHPLATAYILADVQMDVSCIAAGLLHDVVEDSQVTIEQIQESFGPEVAAMVDGVTKLKLADFERRESEVDSTAKKNRAEMRRNAENLRKIFLAVATDLRVMMIKLSDRLHNMQTLYALPPDRQKKVAEETQQIYAPLAHRLGVWKLKWQLEDLSFKYLEPENYEKLVEMVDRTRAERENDIQEASRLISEALRKAGIDAEIQGRPKHLWSIYQKMLKEKVNFEDIYDLTAVRVIVNTVPDCYYALGVVHDLWIPIPERFDDYIAKAKPNMYQSLHTKVIGPRREPLEIQIRTWEMHRTAEFGIAAHWQYKEGSASVESGFDRKLSWLRQQLFNWQADSRDDSEFLRSVINDLFTDQVFVFTPAGDVIDLPAGSTPVDFAYRIHSDLGNHCVAAKVNGRIVPLSHKLANGAIVEIVTRSNSAPSLDWLAFTKTSHARTKIKTYFRRLQFNDSVIKGRELLEKECDRRGLERSIMKGDALIKAAAALNKNTEEDMLAAIGFGHLGASAVMHRIAPPELPTPTLTPSGRVVREGRVQVTGAEDMLVNRANCCLPVPGDDVVGFISRGKGLVIHRDSCPNVAHYRLKEPERLMPVDWKGEVDGRYLAEIKIETLDTLGLLTEIAAIFSEAKIHIRKANIKSLPQKMASLELKVEVENLAHLNLVLANVAKLNDVLRIHRIGGRPLRPGAR